MKIILLTRTGRHSGKHILKALVMAKKEVVAVAAEKRLRLLLKKGIYGFIKDSIKKHGWLFLWERTREVLKFLGKRRKDSLRNICNEHNIPLYIVDNHNSFLTEGILSFLKPDILITANTRIIKDNILKIPHKAAINFHTSKLPQYAGLDSIFWALYHGEKEIGVTIHFLKEGIDTGDIILQKTIPINLEDDLSFLTQKAHNMGAQLMLEAVERLEKGDFKGVPQDLSRRTYFSWPTPSQRRELRRKLKKREKGENVFQKETHHKCR